MKKVFVAATLAMSLTGCGAVRLKAGPLNTHAGVVVGPQMGASVTLVTADDTPVVGVDVRAAVDGIVSLVTGLVRSLND